MNIYTILTNFLLLNTYKKLFLKIFNKYKIETLNRNFMIYQLINYK